MRKVLIALALLLTPTLAAAQGYTTPPILQAFQATGLSMPYTGGLVTVGGFQQQINAGTLVLADNQNACNSPQYPACNFVYWGGFGVALSVTTSPQIAFAGGNAIVGFVTTVGGAIQNVVYFSQASNLGDNLFPSVAVILGATGTIRLPVCNAVLTRQCQPSTGSLSGY